MEGRRGTPVGAILLAAGESRRMGSPKPLLDWGGRTLIEYQIAQLQQAGAAEIVAILGHRADEVKQAAEQPGVRIVVNQRYAEGRASSLRAGAAAIDAAADDAVVVAGVDQPRPAGVIRRLVQELAASGNRIVVPVHGGRRGHPVVVAGALLPELREVSEESQGLRAVLARHEADILEVPFDSTLVLLDINTLEEYEAAKAVYFAQGRE